MTLATILEQARTLTPHDRRELLKRLIDILDDEPRPMRRLTELRGLGAELWQGIDAQAYIDQLRDEWDAPLP